jgi:hypothetical protein
VVAVAIQTMFAVDFGSWPASEAVDEAANISGTVRHTVVDDNFIFLVAYDVANYKNC